jgi:hypothetical protein
MTRILVALLLTLLPSLSHASLQDDARSALKKSTTYLRSISTNGGYLWSYSEDLKDRRGESEATETQIWVQPPGTPAVGLVFLRAYSITNDRFYLDAARDVADALSFGQLESGGWDYRIDFDPKSTRWYRRADVGRLKPDQIARRRNNTVFDDQNTQSAIRFLLAHTKATKGSADPRDAKARDTLDYALKKMLEAQYPNGAWPQVYPGTKRNDADYPVLKARFPGDWRAQKPVKEYWYHYTFNDNAMRDCLQVMLEAHAQLDNPEYLSAAKRCGDFILLAQLPDPQPAWAQQYNAQMEPCWARKFEPPAVCSNESAGLINALIDLHVATNDDRYLQPIPATIAWLKRSQISPNRWSRFYELKTNRPFYFTRDYQLTYSDTDLPTHYSFQSEYGIASTIHRFEQLQKLGRTELQKREQQKRTQPPSDDTIRDLLSSLDPHGRWLTNRRIDMQTSVRNLNVLCNYLDAR